MRQISFQCPLVSIHPLFPEEFAEAIAVYLDTEADPRWLTPRRHEEAILSACSSLITIREANGSKFPHQEDIHWNLPYINYAALCGLWGMADASPPYHKR
jgi:hypothetical protein